MASIFGKWQALAIVAVALILSSGCDVQRRKSDAELGLNPQQAAGRRHLRPILRSLPRALLVPR